MYLTDATYTTRDRLLSTSLWNTIRSNLCNFLHKFTGCPSTPLRPSAAVVRCVHWSVISCWVLVALS
jgi:hypothetical protein